MMDPNLAGIILAAGESSRMGRPKACVLHEGRSFLEHTVNCLLACRVSNITVVTGTHHDVIVDAVQTSGLDVKVLRNLRAAEGQFVSLQTGIRSLPADVDGVMVHLVDHPFVKHSTPLAMVEWFKQTRSPLVIPSHDNRRGHPVILSAELFDDLLQGQPEEGMRSFFQRHEKKIVHVEVDDPGIRIDIDTPKDLAVHK